MNDWDEVRARVDIFELVKKEVQGTVKKVGINTYNLDACPFCGGHDCFRISTSNQLFNCFQCDAGGNVFSFIERIKKISGFEALKYLADYCGFPINGKAGASINSETVKRQKIFTAAMEYYNSKLTGDKKAAAWLSDKRGHSIKTIEQFKIGWTAGARKGLYNHLKDSFSETEMKDSGLVKYGDNGYYDFFPVHVYIFPHFVHGRCSHFTFKDPTKKLAYQLPNSRKLNGHLFYGQDAFYYDRIILVEGENDRITTMRISGEKNVAAIIGQISQEQIDFMRRFCKGKQVYCCFDNDEPGIKYTYKIIEALAGLAQVFVMRIP